MGSIFRVLPTTEPSQWTFPAGNHPVVHLILPHHLPVFSEQSSPGGTWLPEWHKAFPKIHPAFSMKTREWQYPQVASQGLKSEVQFLMWRQIKFFVGLQKVYWGQGYRWIYLETHSRALCRNGFLQCCSWDEISSWTHLISKYHGLKTVVNRIECSTENKLNKKCNSNNLWYNINMD